MEILGVVDTNKRKQIIFKGYYEFFLLKIKNSLALHINYK